MRVEPDRLALRIGVSVLTGVGLGLAFSAVLVRATAGLITGVLAWLGPADPTRSELVAALVAHNRHLLWLAGISYLASVAILWNGWRRNLAVLLSGSIVFTSLTLAAYCLLAAAQGRHGSPAWTNAAGLVSMLMPGIPMLLVFLARVGGHGR